MAARYQWIILQGGALALRPDGRCTLGAVHACTSILVWPEGEQPSTTNALLTDPSYTIEGQKHTARLLAELGLRFTDVRWIFVTHRHWDHMPHLPESPHLPGLIPFLPGDAGPFSGLSTVHCPGHDPDLFALVFRSSHDEDVWVVGDAILDEEWLMAWGYYWPNRYTRDEIVETWRSVAKIVAGADVIVPGHGPPIRVTPSLVEALLEGFPGAEYAKRCPEVGGMLRDRLQTLREER